MVAAWCGPGHWALVFPLFWAAVILVFALGFRRRRGRWHVDSGQSVLGERYARGEITEDEYRSRRTVLRER